MQTDELRAELTDLANEVAPFAGDLPAIRRRVTRRRAASASVAIVVIAALAVGAIALTRSNRSHVSVALSVKELGLTDLPRFDAAVAMRAGATPDDVVHVQETLGNSAAVENYAVLPAIVLARALTNDVLPSAKRLRARVCSAPSTQSFAIELSRNVPNALAQLSAAIGADAVVQSIGLPNVDVEVFMHVRATAAETAATRSRIAQDADVVNVTYLDHQAAFEEFKRLFADQPNLVNNQTPAGLPESFRLEVRSGASLDQVAERFGHLPGVDQTIIPSKGLDLNTAPDIPSGQANLVMKVNATNAEVADLRATLALDPIIDSYASVDRGASYDKVVKLFRGEREGAKMVQANIDRNHVPALFRITLRSQDDALSFVGGYQATPGIKFLQISHDPLREACISSAMETSPSDSTPATTAPAP